MKTNEIDSVISEHIKANTLSHRKDMLPHIFEILGIKSYLDQFEVTEYQSTFSQDSQVYHNQIHSHAVALNCYEAMYSTELPFSKEDKQALMIAALYHDAWHTKGHSTDSDNIVRAYGALKVADGQIQKKVSPGVFNKAIALIKLTQYPYTKNTESVPARILRDADLMMAYEEDRIATDLLCGLFNESNVARKRDLLPEAKFKDFVESNTLFLQKIQWQTRWARNKALLLNFPKRVKELRTLLLNTETIEV